MAIPGVFTPVEMNGRVLADGGMVQNIPVETVRAMDADAVIAVELHLPPGNRTQLETLTGVLNRAVDVMVTQNERRSLALGQAQGKRGYDRFHGDGLFPRQGTHRTGLQERGQPVGRSSCPMRFTIPRSGRSIWRRARRANTRSPRKLRPSKSPAPIPTPTAASSTSSARSCADRSISTKLDTQLTRIAGEGQFDRLGYEGFTQNGVPALRVTAHEKSYGPPFVDLAVNVDGSGVAAFDFSAGARVTFMDVAHHGGEWRNDLLFGSSNLAATEFYQPLGQSRFFVAPYAFASKFARNSFTGLTRVAVFGDERAGGGFDIGYNSGRRSEFRVGYEIFDGKLSPLIGAAGLPIVNGSTGEFRARYVWDGQDSPSVPARGTRAVVTLSRVLQSPGLAHPIGQLDVQTSSFLPVGPKTSLFFDISGGTTFRGSAGPFQVFALGGPFRLGAYLPQEFLGNHYAYSSLGFRRELYRLPALIGGKIYWGGWYEAGTAFGTAIADPGPVAVRGTFNLGVIADTIVGPLALAASVSPTGQSRINFSMGRLF